MVAERILKILSNKDILNKFSNNSYELANNFLLYKIEEKWKEILY